MSHDEWTGTGGGGGSPPGGVPPPGGAEPLGGTDLPARAGFARVRKKRLKANCTSCLPAWSKYSSASRCPPTVIFTGSCRSSLTKMAILDLAVRMSVLALRMRLMA